jgi:hypothetical protein
MTIPNSPSDAPTVEELRAALMSAAGNLAEHVAVSNRLRWLSESLAGMMEDTQRLTWLERAVLREGAGSVSLYEDFTFDANEIAVEILDDEGLRSAHHVRSTLREAIDAARRALDSTASPVSQSLVSDSREDTP